MADRALTLKLSIEPDRTKFDAAMAGLGRVVDGTAAKLKDMGKFNLDPSADKLDKALDGVDRKLNGPGGAGMPGLEDLAKNYKMPDLTKGLDVKKKLSPFGEIGGKAGSFFGEEAAGVGAELGEALGPVGVAVAAVKVGLDKLTDAFKAFFNFSLEAVSKSIPTVTERFNRASDDTTAVIGSRLVPVVRLLTEWMRLWGDLLQTILPSANDFAEALSPISDYFKDVRKALEDVAPALKAMIKDGLILFTITLRAALFPLKLVMQAFDALFHALGGQSQKLADSTNAAARSISFGDFESSAKAVYAAAGLGGKQDLGVGDLFGPGTPLADAILAMGRWANWALGKAQAAGQAVSQTASNANAGVGVVGLFGNPIQWAINQAEALRKGH